MDSARHFQLISTTTTKKENPFAEEKNENLVEESDNDESNMTAKTEFSSVGKQTFLIKMQTQNENHNEWFKEDLKNLSFGVFFQINFLSNGEKLPKDLNKIEKEPILLDFNQIATKFFSNKFSFKVLNNDWTPFDQKDESKITSNGFSMKQNILRINNPLNLRSLSCKVHIDLKIQGMSTFNILMRTFEKFDNEEAYIIQYRKEGFCESTRLYVLLGKIDKNEFIFVKKCEIPLLSIPQQLASEDFLNIIAEVLDFGNDRIYIFTYLNDKLSKPFKLKYENLLIPVFENFQLYFMGNGDDTYIKSLLVEIFDRKDFFSEKENKNVCNKCKNCVIF